jgi:hypothetical protein
MIGAQAGTPARLNAYDHKRTSGGVETRDFTSRFAETFDFPFTRVISTVLKKSKKWGE